MIKFYQYKNCTTCKKAASDDEKLELLSSDGMLVKRPLAVMGDKITLGFKEDQYKETWLA